MFVGRERERERLDSWLQQPSRGRSSALQVLGPAGIGKTALIEDLLGRSRDWPLLRVQGLESEAQLAYHALADLLRPVLDHVESIPARQQEALRSALAIGPAVPGDRFAVAAATLSLLAAAAQTPTLVVVEDLHALDPASAEAILFAGRRLGNEGVALILSCRTGHITSRQLAGIETLALDGLDVAATAELLAGLEGRSVDARQAQHVHDLTGGNPLAVIEFSAAQTERLTVEERLRNRVAAAPRDAQQVLLVLACEEQADLARLARVVGDSAARRGVDAAVEAKLLRPKGTFLAFQHPLLRSAVLAVAGVASCRQTHRAIADTFDQEQDGQRRVWHLAAAAERPDVEAGDLLEQTAHDIRARRGPAASSLAFARSAELSDDGHVRARRRLLAGRDADSAGLAAHAIALLREALAEADDPALRSEIEAALGWAVAWHEGTIDSAYRFLLAAAERAERIAPQQAVQLYLTAGWTGMAGGAVRRGVEASLRALELLERAPVGAPPGLLALIGSHLVCGGEARGPALLLENARRLAATDGAQPEIDPTVGHALFWLEQFDLAERLLQRTIDSCREAAALSALPFALGSLAELEYRRGRWSHALALAYEATALAADIGSHAEAYCLAMTALIVGQQGRSGELQVLTDSALSIIDERSLESVRDYVVHAHGLAALARGDAARAVVELEKLYDLLLGHGVRDPSVVPYAPDLIEAYARTRRRGRAQAVLAVFTEEAERTQRSWALACVARCRGLLAGDDECADHFDQALILHERAPMPFDRARTELCYGERLRRSRRRGDARRFLHRALTTFEQLGAEPWAERAQAELAASGEILTDRLAAGAQTLRPQELQIAILVGKGATNKEIAATLFLSVKTIEFHLTNVYRRLDLRSRAQLAALIARSDPAPSTVATLPEE